MSVLSTMKGVAARDQQMIRETETMFGPEPESMGFMKNLFWGRIREDLVFPYPEVSDAETVKTEALLAELNHYLDHEHPRVEIDQEQHIPEWVIKRLFDMGVMGMTVPEQYGGLGLSVASYNRVLEAIGRRCGSTARTRCPRPASRGTGPSSPRRSPGWRSCRPRGPGAGWPG